MIIRSKGSFPGVAEVADAWYLAGGAPMPVVAYQPIGAASLADSYVNLANPRHVRRGVRSLSSQQRETRCDILADHSSPLRRDWRRAYWQLQGSRATAMACRMGRKSPPGELIPRTSY
jgi:hypothetical protein